ncbi:hypothetical protein BZA77DRAFT_244393 [Pyronema omphalodes]|nr:hypothetical protein BZA77DRAFT_244393 [Pyronema omphalodes]
MGSARILLSSFYRPHPTEHPRAFDQTNVDPLKAIFCNQGVRRTDRNNHIPVLLSEDDLHLALQRPDVQESDLRNHPMESPPLLKFREHSLRYLYGRHRLAAAESLLDQNDRWWIVDIYLQDGAFLAPQSACRSYVGRKKSHRFLVV